MTLLRDLPEGLRLVADETPDAPIEAVEWLDADGDQVRLHFEDGSTRTASGLHEVEVSADTAVPREPITWAPPTSEERVGDAWDAYIAGDQDAVTALLEGIDEVAFTGDYNLWSSIESGLVLRAIVLEQRGQTDESATTRARLNVESRATDPKLARKVLQRRFSHDLPEHPELRLRESARRWARAGAAGVDGEPYLRTHLDTLAELRAGSAASD